MNIHARRPRLLLSAFLAVLLVTGCKVQLVAPYDDDAFEAILATATQVDLFYGRLLETPPDERPYAAFSDPYIEIEAEIRSLWLRNTAREDNVDSEQIIKEILGQWTSYRDRHAERDGYSDGNADLDRDRLRRMFESAARAEAAKRRDE